MSRGYCVLGFSVFVLIWYLYFYFLGDGIVNEVYLDLVIMVIYKYRYEEFYSLVKKNEVRNKFLG